MDEFGASVLRRACLACASWPGEVSVSVNLSPAQFRGGRVVETVREALAAANLPADRLDLEITESTLLDDRGSTRETLEALRALGVRISLDDFGTGYSSLSYVLAFPLDRIKIDRSFTIGLGVQERASILVESVAQMCGKLGNERAGRRRRDGLAAALHRAAWHHLGGAGLLFQPGRALNLGVPGLLGARLSRSGGLAERRPGASGLREVQLARSGQCSVLRAIASFQRLRRIFLQLRTCGDKRDKRDKR